jgi:DNA polymerase-3 subunit delta'
VALAAAYRDRLAEGTLPDPAAGVIAVEAVHDAIESMERNPNERLLLEALLLRLPPV